MSEVLFRIRLARIFSPENHVRSVASSSKGPNHEIIGLLTRNFEEERAKGQQFKAIAFARAIKAIKQLDHAIRSAEETRNIEHIGPGIAKRIAEYLHPAENLSAEDNKPVKKQDPARRRQAIATLQLVPGIGKTRAAELVDDGCMTLEQLREPRYVSQLLPATVVGLRFAQHLVDDATREQTEAVISLIREIVPADFELYPVGKFRRGLPTSPTISLSFFNPSFDPPIQPPSEPQQLSIKRDNRGRRGLAFGKHYTTIKERATSLLLQDIVEPLKKEGLIAATFTAGSERFTGVVRVPERVGGRWENTEERVEGSNSIAGTFRKLELTLAPFQSKSAALLTLTGDDEFLRDVHSAAKAHDMILNEYGLWRWVPDESQSHDMTDQASEVAEDMDIPGRWEPVRADTEADLLTEVGKEWVDPEKRNFGFITGRGATHAKRGRPKKSP